MINWLLAVATASLMVFGAILCAKTVLLDTDWDKEKGSVTEILYRLQSRLSSNIYSSWPGRITLLSLVLLMIGILKSIF